MNKFRTFLFSLVVFYASSLFPQVIGFEEGIPATFKSKEGSELLLSTLYYKEGKQSLEWKYQPSSTIGIQLSPLLLDKAKEERYGITLWIYNEEVSNDSLVFQFIGKEGEPSYDFAFRLTAVGWRACWIGFQHMQGNKVDKELVELRIQAPDRKGRVFLDRLTLPEKNINLRTTPDMQMPFNNSLTFRDLWHWCRVWQWEQYKYDIPIATDLSTNQRTALQLIAERLDEYAQGFLVSRKQIKEAYQLLKAADIRPSGNGYAGAPIVAPDEQNKKAGELSWRDIETMLVGFASDYLIHKNPEAKANYFTVFAYAINQGFAYGSGMGTNHHYGYAVRKIYTSAWLMRNEIYKDSARKDILSTLTFWSALQETRQSYQFGRDELLDSWHTLLMPKFISAMLVEDEREKDQAMRGLSRWISSSLSYTPGTIGGIKVDGTTFHHGGFYPAYTTGALAMIGHFIGFTLDTDYGLTVEGRKVFKSALDAIRNYSNLYEWGIGIGGRHPFTGSMKTDDVQAFDSLAMAGDLSGTGKEIDYSLAADYLRLEPKTTPQSEFFRSKGIKPAKAPQGFFVYNYGSAGIFRRDNWMVTLKGYNTDVWGAEIYTRDNRYGRYQSYGSVQIFGKASSEARLDNGYLEAGWDWNRLPGTTTIHLPFDLLDSPHKGTTMARSTENFSGSTSWQGKHGIFAMKLMERDIPRFTPDFVARKSVFCFDNRMICLGTGISNSNTDYSTETTLFQNAYRSEQEAIRVNSKAIKGSLKEKALPNGKMNTLWDGYGNYYQVKKGHVHVQVSEQTLRHNKTREETKGVFSTAWISHGKSPQKESYEYLVLIQSTEKEAANAQRIPLYQVLHCDNTAHIVHDLPTDILAYVSFDNYLSEQTSEVIYSIGAETMIMLLQKDNRLQMSVCDPNLNIREKTYTTKEPSRVVEKEIQLKGKWKLVGINERIQVTVKDNLTKIIVSCQDGIPVEFELEEI